MDPIALSERSLSRIPTTPPEGEPQYCEACRKELPCLCPVCSVCGERSCHYIDCGLNELEAAEERDRQICQAEDIHEEERREA